MEMDFRDTGRRRRFLLLTVGVALALVAGWSAYSLGTRGTEAPQVVKQAVLVASRDVAARETVTADDVVVREVAVDEVLASAYVEPTQVVGRVTAVPIYANQQLTPSLFATAQAGTDFSILEPDEEITLDSPYWRAVSVAVPSNRAVGGEIKDGQHIDLFVSVDIELFAVDAEGNFQKVETATDDQLHPGKSTKITFQDLKVLKAKPDEGIYVVRMTLDQAEQIAHITQMAPDSITAVLRPEEDTRIADHKQFGTTNDTMVMQYYFRVPELLDLVELLAGNGQLEGAPTPSGDTLPLPGDEPTPAPEEPAESPEPSPEP